MCKLCDAGNPQPHAWNSRRGFLMAASASTAAGIPQNLFNPN
jgi:hypothetical protein